MVSSKLLTLTFVLNLVSSSLQSSYIQDDILAFPRYKVIVTRDKLANTDVGLKEPVDNNIIMTSSSGQPFYCSIPNVQVEQDRIEREKKEIEQGETEEDIKKTIERGLELLEPLGVNCIRFYTSTNQYWAYEYCHNQYVRQFHIERSHDGKHEQEKETASFYLGVYPGLSQADAQSLYKMDPNSKALLKPAIKPSHVKAPTELKKEKDKRYLVQTWQDGSICDITEKPRTIEVQYHCDIQGPDRVSSFMEVSTCNYQIIISTPRLCEEMSLSRRHYTEPHQIKCRPIVSEKLIEQEKQQEKQEEEEEKQQEQQPIEQEEEPKQEENEEQSFLLNMISELTEQINQLKLQMNTIDQADVSFLSFDEQGNLISDPDFTKLIKSTLEKSSKGNPVIEKEEKPNDQHENKQAYHQKYIAVE